MREASFDSYVSLLFLLYLFLLSSIELTLIDDRNILFGIPASVDSWFEKKQKYQNNANLSFFFCGQRILDNSQVS